MWNAFFCASLYDEIYPFSNGSEVNKIRRFKKERFYKLKLVTFPRHVKFLKLLWSGGPGVVVNAT